MPTRAPAPKLADLSPMLLSERKTVPRCDGWHFEIKVSARRTHLDRGDIEGEDRVHLNLAW
ncbi:MAG: hypothetical protein ACN6QA_05235, partial [Cupriavidus sp.]